MGNRYTADVLILGGTSVAAGAAEVLCKRGLTVIILDRSQLCGSEYGDALLTNGLESSYSPKTDEGKSYKDELLRRGILTEQGISLPATIPVLSSRLLTCGTVYFGASCLISLENGSNGYTASFTSMGQEHSIRFKVLLDTTSESEALLFLDPRTRELKKRLAVNTAGEVPGAAHGAFDGECFPSVEVCNEDYDAARVSLASLLDEAGAKAAASPLTAIVCNAHPETWYCETFISAASVYYGNTIAAYDRGAEIGVAISFGGVRCTFHPCTIKDAGSADVVVVGGGTAGSYAALKAAQKGCKVIVLEDSICLGGIMTAGGIYGYYYGMPGGIFTSTDERAAELMKTVPALSISKDTAKRTALSETLHDAGVTIRYGATFTQALTEGRRTIGVRYRTDAGFFDIRTKFVIDATAEGLVAVSAGAGMMGGRVTDNGYQPYSSVYGSYLEERGQLVYRYSDNGVIDAYDPVALGHAILASRADAAHLREEYSSAKRLVHLCQRLGLREGRKIIGEATVTLEDLLSGKVTDEPVLWGYSNLDNHGKDNPFESPLCRCWNTVASMWGYNLTIPVPAGALIPKGIDGLLVAGRCLSVDHVVASAVRMKYDMEKSGEVAGLLASTAIRLGCSPREVPYSSLRAELLASGCLSEGTHTKVVKILRDRTQVTVSGDKLWTDDPKEIRTGLESDSPAYAMWSASVNREKLRSYLVEWIQQTSDTLLRRHAALALGLAGTHGCEYSEAVPEILRMVEEKTGEAPASSRKYNYPYAAAAITLADLLGLRQAIPALKTIVSDPAYAADIPMAQSMIKAELTEDTEDMKFLWFLQAFCALLGLYQRYPKERAGIAKVIESRIYDPDFRLSVTGKAAAYVRIDYTEKVRKLYESVK